MENCYYNYDLDNHFETSRNKINRTIPTKYKIGNNNFYIKRLAQGNHAYQSI